MHLRSLAASALIWSLAGCFSGPADGLAPAHPASTTVKYDWLHRPLPEIPLPNDIATRYDATSATRLRLNASMLAPTELERGLRRKVDELDGWGVFQHVTVPFTGPLDVSSILAGHRDPYYETHNDVIYLIDVDPDSPEFGRLHHLDLGNGNYPVVLENRDYYSNDTRHWLSSILFEEEDEDRNGNGRLDPGGDADGDGVLSDDEWPEDTDGDGVLDKPNYLPGASPDRDDAAALADALMSFYERETHTLIARPMKPLRERTTYAVVVTRRLLDADGEPVGSPFEGINHSSQTKALEPLPRVLPPGLTLSDVAFAFSFTTQSINAHWRAVRDGLYGHGVQAHLAEQFPARMKEVALIRDPTNPAWKDVVNPHVLYLENVLPVLPLVGGDLLGIDRNSNVFTTLEESLHFIDLLTMGSYESPQLFFRSDDEGNPLHLNDQTWPVDLDRVPARARSETVHWTLYLPRKEVSARQQGQMVPVIFHGHGYTSNRLESLLWAGFFARHGIATVAIDCPSHGLGISSDELAQVDDILALVGLDGFVGKVLEDRAFDQNGDGRKDSGADFWSAYLFHTRDMVRQCALDYMQLVRILDSFDGVRTWQVDVNGDGVGDLAGDFDGDGHVDIGRDSVFGASGSSLGGIMASMLASLEPRLAAAVPICGGGGLTDVGNRSTQGGVREAVQLRLMSPIYIGGPDPDSGATLLETVVPNLNDDATLQLATVDDVQPGDTVVGVNLANDETRCAYVTRQGRFRLALPSDLGDRTELHFYRGPKLTGRAECQLMKGAQPYRTVDTLGRDVVFQGQAFAAGEPLRAMAEGQALRRGSPELRRLLTLAQLAVDPADPAVLAPNLSETPLFYPGTGESTGTHTLILTTMGDMSVPASAGVTHGRAAGFIDYLKEDPRYAKSANQVLRDTWAIEAVHSLGRFHDNRGEPVHMDLENFSDGDDIFTPLGIPRLDPPLRLVGPDKLCEHTPENCGISGSLFPYPKTSGKHDLPLPGDFLDQAADACFSACYADDVDAECAHCESVSTFDIGLYWYNLVGRFIASGGTELDLGATCNAFNDCPDLLPSPPGRSLTELP